MAINPDPFNTKLSNLAIPQRRATKITLCLTSVKPPYQIHRAIRSRVWGAFGGLPRVLGGCDCSFLVVSKPLKLPNKKTKYNDADEARMLVSVTPAKHRTRSQSVKPLQRVETLVNSSSQFKRSYMTFATVLASPFPGGPSTSESFSLPNGNATYIATIRNLST